MLSGASAFYAEGLRLHPNTSDLVFYSVRTNEGNDYNETSGVFIAEYQVSIGFLLVFIFGVAIKQ